MSSWWQEAGLGETNAGKFLRSLAETGRPPYGRGVDWLDGLMRQGDPRPSVTLGRELEPLIPLAGADADTLTRMVANLKAGNPPKDWYKDFLVRVQQKARNGSSRPPTPDEVRMAANISIYKSGQSDFYWARKPGTSNKIDKITAAVLNGASIFQEDIDYLLSNFKGLVKVISRTDTDGKLIWVGADSIIDEATRFKVPGDAKEQIPVILCGSPYVDQHFRKPVIKGLANCKPVLLIWESTKL